jgi:hypothetical protein
MPDASYEKFVKAQKDLREGYPKPRHTIVNISSRYYMGALRGPWDRCEDEAC